MLVSLNHHAVLSNSYLSCVIIIVFQPGVKSEESSMGKLDLLRQSLHIFLLNTCDFVQNNDVIMNELLSFFLRRCQIFVCLDSGKY